MKNLKLRVTVLIIITFLSSLSFSQQERRYNYPAQLEYNNVLIETMAGAQILCSSMVILPDSNMIQYFDLISNQKMEKNLKEISTIGIQSGNKAVTQGLFGALGGFSAFALIFQISGGENTKMSESTLNALCAGCTGCGLISGIYTGSQQKTYKTIYRNGDFIN